MYSRKDNNYKHKRDEKEAKIAGLGRSKRCKRIDANMIPEL
jgi:hypothetical protein